MPQLLTPADPGPQVRAPSRLTQPRWLQDNAEAAGWYIAGLLQLAEETGAEAHSSGSKEADADADGRGAAAPPWPPPPSSDKAASAEHCARVFRWGGAGVAAACNGAAAAL